jgi:glyceraldehyde-3-phosphate dehydrogenase (NAD(P))
MERKIVHVVGTGTIGEPLIGLLCDYHDKLGIDEITFNKNTPLRGDRSKVIDLLKRGARLAVSEDSKDSFKDLGMDPELETVEAISRASVIIDCTPSGVGHKNKEQYYSKFADKVKGFMAQGSEDGFGIKYARGINDSILKNGDHQFVQIVSCNTHNIACITHTLTLDGYGPENLREGRFVCVRRANDTSQAGSFIPAPAVGAHVDETFGSHHAKDASELFLTLGFDLNLFSSAMKVNSQYMHVLWFYLKTKEPTNLNEVKDRLVSNELVAMTTKDMTSTVYSFGRDHGHFGRILNQAVVVEQSLHVRNDHEVYGFCFTPQDGNSILSSISAAERFLYPHSYENKIQCLNELFFEEI